MFDYIVLCPTGSPDPGVPIAASRAGALGVVSFELTDDLEAALAQLARLCELGRGRRGALVDRPQALEAVLGAGLDGLDTILLGLGGFSEDALEGAVARVHEAGLKAYAVATGIEHALAAAAAGADAIIAKGHESGGWIGEEGAFVLCQRLVQALATSSGDDASPQGPLPVFVQGGIGLRTVAAAHVAGAAGVVLDAQLLLARESPAPAALRKTLAALDGSETAALGEELGASFRIHSRPGLRGAELLRAAASSLEGEREIEAGEGARERWRAAVRTHASAAGADAALPLGQDAAFAAELARRFGTVAGILDGLRAALEAACATLAAGNPLAEGAGVSGAHRTRYPIVQGPMTRVSDRAEFAAAVAEGGALPFLALALMRGPDADRLLARAGELAGDRSWGVGVLGFVPAELRAEQLAVVRAHRPPFALIAGGRPSQARELEAEGIETYLHVPSPQLLRLYLREGARRFVFEGRECGGHVGPRTSFVLWDSVLGVLEEDLPGDASDVQILLAGGVHDARSAAMAAAATAAASARGAQVGVLMGTSYLFTREATECGAITPLFQQAAIAASDTALLESGPGHATRCLPSPFVEQFYAERRRLRETGLDAEELRGQLEQLNIGRLRIASKGKDRGEDRELVEVDAAEQWERGMYMIGQVAAMHDAVTTVAELHSEISDGSSELLRALAPAPARRPAAPAPPPADVAIVGMACILPGAPDVQTLWANILDKVDAIGEVPPERWDWRVMFDPDPAARDKVYSRWGGFIDPVELDPLALGMPPRSLESIEPFQLLALLCAQAALRDAGYATRPFERERTSVILGAGGGGADKSVGYTVRSALPSLLGDAEPELQQRIFERLPEWTEDSFAGLLMNVAAGRIANRLDFGGTNYTVDAACASSLSAVGQATRELQMGTSDMALAGGVDAIQNPFAYLCFAKTHALSPSGRCRPFDAAADGIAISEGFATIVLKRLADAERDGDRIYAVIRGVGAASDGRDRSLTAPRPEGQMRALRRAYAQARFSPDTVELVEAHGTGTVAGDGAEIKALGTVFREHSERRQWCAVGSVKSMIGHTKATAGVAGVIKAALSLHHRVLAPTIGVSEPNPKADFPNSPFYVNSEARPWLASEQHPRRAGVSAFGFGGTDFHIVLEEHQGSFVAPDAAVTRWPAELLLIAGAGEELPAALERLQARLAGDEQLAPAALARELAAAAAGRERGAPTLAIVADTREDLLAKLERARELLAGGAERIEEREGIYFHARPPAAPAPKEDGSAEAGKIAFLFPGQGSQTLEMGRELAIAFPEARAQFELADRVLAGRYERPLSRYVFPPPWFSAQEKRARQAELTDTHVAQAALGATELACLSVLRALGVEPELTAGHSYGEFAALFAAGGLDAETLLRVSEARGRFMKEAAEAEAGAMIAVEAPPQALTQLLEGGGVVTANLNSPAQTVLSGPREHVEAALEWCRERDIGARMLPVACAFHSPHVAGAQQRLAETLAQTTIATPRIPVYSNTTGAAHAPEPEAVGALLSEHLSRPVEFVREVEAMYGDGARVFVEVGPRSVLSGLVPQILGEREHVAIPIERSGRPALASLLHCLGALAAAGVPLELERLWRGRPEAQADLSSDRRETARPGAAWLVDGGRAWPAGAQREPARPIQVPNQEENVVIRTSTNGGALAAAPNPEHPGGAGAPAPAVVAAAVAPAAPAPPAAGQQPAPALGAAAPAPLAGDRVADVILRHQEVMQQFLDTQRTVMLGYLGAAGAPGAARAAGALAQRPAPALPAPAPAALSPQPAVQAPPPAPHAAQPVVQAPQPAVQAAQAPVAQQPVAQAPQPAAAAAPAQVPAAATPAPASNGAGSGASGAASAAMSREQIAERLLALVSERTGYPADMLSLDADLEGDLGIDSIKRVEIAGTFTQSLDEADRESIDIEELTAARTLTAVIDALEAALAGSASGGPPGEPVLEGQRPFDREPAEQERIGRLVVQAASAPAITASAGLRPGGVVVIVDDETGVGEQLAALLQARGQRAVRVGAQARPGERAQAEELAASLAAQGPVSALVHLAALAAPSPQGERPPAYGGLDTLFALVQALREQLEACAQEGGAALLAATRLGGAFGVDRSASGPDGEVGTGDGAPHAAAAGGALHGFLKTAALEWPAVRVKAVDLPEPAGREAELEAERAGRDAELLLAELSAADGLVEVGYRDGRRTQLEVVPTPLGGRQGELELDERSVVLVTGGARGITARAALMLAERHRPKLVLVGRTSDEPEDEATAGLSELSELREAMIAARRADGRPLTPALVEKDCARIMQAREARENLALMRQAGSQVEYLICDVSDPSAFGELIDSVYAEHGRIDGVLHGAGVIEDKLIRDKQPDSLARVLATKAGAARTLAERLRPEELRFLVFFSSVSGRFGNSGQADYAAASEVLGKLAHELDARWPGRVVSIDWGPWRSAGMVSEWLEQEFARRGVALIALEQGCTMLYEELARGRKGESEIVIGAATGLAGDDAAAASTGAVAAAAQPAAAAEPAAAAQRAGAGASERTRELPLLAGAEIVPGDQADAPAGALRARYTFSLERDRYLDHHRIDGRPVLPFAVAMELMAQAAVAASPGRAVHGLREIRLFDGVALDDDAPRTVQIDVAPQAGGAAPRTGGKAGASGRAEELLVTISPLEPAPRGRWARAHYRSRVTLREPRAAGATGIAGGAVAPPAPLEDAPAFPTTIEDAYRELLFHGPLFQGIAAIERIDERGASSLLLPSHAGRCVQGADGLGWLLDPVLLDSALQVQVLWARLQWDVTLLPAEIDACTRLGELPADGPVRHELRIRAESKPPLCNTDHWFYAPDGRPVAVMQGVVGVGAQKLNRLAGAKQ